MDPVTGAVIPPKLVPGMFVTFSADNIDILDESLDGKNTFHATQVSSFICSFHLNHIVFV